MHIKKVLNSSVVLLTDEKQAEFIVLGKGIGYGKKPNEEIRVNEKDCQFFIPVTHNKSKQIIELLNSIPPEIFELTHEVIVLAKKELAIELMIPYILFWQIISILQSNGIGKILF